MVTIQYSDSNLLCYRAQVVVTLDIVSPPLRERNRSATCAKHRKAQNEQAGQACAVESASNEVRVVLK
jgi:hypothetical protein